MPSNLPVHWGFSGGRAAEETEALDWIELLFNCYVTDDKQRRY